MIAQTPIFPCDHPGMARRRLLAAGAAALMLGGALPARAAVRLPVAAALGDELRLALAGGSPLVVMVSLPGCPFCNVVRDSFLGPLLAEEQLPVVQVDMRNARALQDFAGKASTHDQMARNWGIRVAPTVLFFGKGGVEVAERMVGGYIPDFYGAYLDERLRQARRALKA